MVAAAAVSGENLKEQKLLRDLFSKNASFADCGYSFFAPTQRQTFTVTNLYFRLTVRPERLGQLRLLDLVRWERLEVPAVVRRRLAVVDDILQHLVFPGLDRSPPGGRILMLPPALAPALVWAAVDLPDHVAVDDGGTARRAANGDDETRSN